MFSIGFLATAKLHCFGKSTLAFIPRFIIKLKGINWWEKKLAFVLRARNIETTLKVEKN